MSWTKEIFEPRLLILILAIYILMNKDSEFLNKEIGFHDIEVN